MSQKVKYVLLFFLSCMSSTLYAINDQKIEEDYKQIYKKYSSYEWVEALRLTEKSLRHSKKIITKKVLKKGIYTKRKFIIF